MLFRIVNNPRFFRPHDAFSAYFTKSYKQSRQFRATFKYYYKTYPTFDVLGTQFAMVRSKAHENLHKLSPVLHKTLVRLEMMPHREFTTPEEFKSALKGADRLIIDATERAYRRSQDDAKQREHYSGKKKSIR